MIQPGGSTEKPRGSVATSVAPRLAALLLLAAGPASAQLVLGIEVNPDPAAPSELVEVQALVANRGGVASGALTLRLTWPSHLGVFPTISGGAVCPGGSCTAGELVTWNLGTLQPGSAIVVDVNDTVVPAAVDGSDITFQFELLEGGVSSLMASHTVDVLASSPLQVTVDPVPDPAAQEDLLVYELHYGNLAGSAASATELRLPLPAGTELVSATGGGTLVSGDVVWNLGTLPANGGGRERATVEVDAGLADNTLLVVDPAELSATVAAQAQQSRAMAMSRVVAGTTLELAAEMNPDPVASGGLLELHARVSNPSVAPTGTLTLRLRWPEHLSGFPAITGGALCPGGSCTAGELVVWNLGTLPAEGSQAVSVSAIVAAAASGTLLQFELELLEDGVAARSLSHTVEVQESPPLELTVDPLPDPVAPGAMLVYELSFANLGGAVASNAELRLALPAGTQFVTANGGGVLAGNAVVWNLGTLAVSSGGKRRVTVEVDPGVANGSLLVVDDATLTAVIATQTKQSRATAASRVLADATLELGAEVNPDPVAPSGLLELYARVSNRGLAPTGTLTLRLRWPEHLSAFPAISGGALCPGGSCTAGEFVVWNLGTLPALGSQAVGVSAIVLAGVASGTLLPFEIELLEDGVPASNMSHTVEVQASPPLELRVDPLPDPVAPGALLVYELSFANIGAAVANSAELRLALPPGTQFVSANGGGALAGNVVVWNLGTLAVSSGGKRRVTVEVDPGVADGSLLLVDDATLTAVVAAQTKQSRATAASRVLAATLELAAEVNPDPVAPSGLVELHLRVSNPTLDPTGTLTLRLRWPEHLNAFPSITGGAFCPGGSCTAGEFVVWDLGTLPGLGSQAVGVSVIVLAGVASGTLLPFELELLEEGAPTRNASHTVEVQASPPLELRVDPVPDPVAPGALLVYELSFANVGAAVASTAELRLALPAGTQFVSANSGGALVENTVVWTLGTLPVNNGGKRRVTVEVDPGLPSGSLLVVDDATLTAVVAAQTRQSRATAASRVLADATLELGAEINPDPVAPSGLVELHLRVSNPTLAPTGTLTLRLRWPEHLNAFPAISGGAVCPGGSCTAGEFVVWDLGTLPAEGSQVVSVGTIVLAGVASGTLLPFEVELLEQGAPMRTLTHTVEVQASSPLELRIDPVPDPVAAGDTLLYELSYGNSGAAVATDVVLRLRLPAGTQFLEVESGGGVVSESGDEVVWNLGALPADGAGRERVTVEVDPALADGTLLVVDDATLSAVVSSLARQARATAVSRVESASTLALEVDVAPDPVQPLQELLTQLRIENLTAQPTGTLLLSLQWPEHLNAFPTLTGPGGAFCPGGSCSAGEQIVWNLGSLAANATVEVSVQENVVAGVSDGTLIPFRVELREAGLLVWRITSTVIVHPFVDSDSDGISDLDDADDDNDGMPDGWELLHCLDPKDASDADQDPDQDGLTSLEEFMAGSHPLCDGDALACEDFVCDALATLDVDGDGTLQPLTDGLLILRYRFGFTGPTLIAGAVAGGCTRCTALQIEDYLDLISMQLDIDGDGTPQALTDGLLILRYLFGFSGPTLIAGAVDDGCTRCTADAIATRLGELD